jgi:hypothetical protein
VIDDDAASRPATGPRIAAPSTIAFRTDTPARDGNLTATTDHHRAAGFEAAPQHVPSVPAAPHQGAAVPVPAPQVQAPVQAREFQAPVQAPVQARASQAPVQAREFQAPVQAREFQAPVQAPESRIATAAEADGPATQLQARPYRAAGPQIGQYQAAAAQFQPSSYPAARVQPPRYQPPVPYRASQAQPASYQAPRYQPAQVQVRPYPAAGYASPVRSASGGASIPRTRPTRPGTLTLGVLAGVGSTGLVIASQVIGLLQGRDAIRSVVSDQIPGGAKTGVLTELLEAAVNAAYRTIEVRAFLALALAAIALVLVLVSLRGALAVRILAVLATLAAGAVTLLSIIDIFPTRGIATGVGALLLVPVTAVLLLLPSASRYRRATRAARTA